MLGSTSATSRPPRSASSHAITEPAGPAPITAQSQLMSAAALTTGGLPGDVAMKAPARRVESAAASSARGAIIWVRLTKRLAAAALRRLWQSCVQQQVLPRFLRGTAAKCDQQPRLRDEQILSPDFGSMRCATADRTWSLPIVAPSRAPAFGLVPKPAARANAQESVAALRE